MGMSLQLFKDAGSVAEFTFDLDPVKEAYSEILEAQKEVGGMVTYRAKVATGGGKAFDILTGDEDADTSVPTFSGVIVYNHNCNAYLRKARRQVLRRSVLRWTESPESILYAESASPARPARRTSSAPRQTTVGKPARICTDST